MKIPFTILIDTAEQIPYTFRDIKGDSRHKNEPLSITTERKYLGPARADYSIDGFEGQIHIERKSLEDAHGTILGFGKDGDRCRRDRFKEELEFLSSVEFGAVVVEASFESLIKYAPQHGKRTREQNAKTISRQVLAWRQDYPVQWFFFWNRRSAEIGTFWMMERFFRKRK